MCKVYERQRGLNQQPPASQPRWYVTYVIYKTPTTLQIWTLHIMGKIRKKIYWIEYFLSEFFLTQKIIMAQCWSHFSFPLVRFYSTPKNEFLTTTKSKMIYFETLTFQQRFYSETVLYRADLIWFPMTIFWLFSPFLVGAFHKNVTQISQWLCFVQTKEINEKPKFYILPKISMADGHNNS